MSCSVASPVFSSPSPLFNNKPLSSLSTTSSSSTSSSSSPEPHRSLTLPQLLKPSTTSSPSPTSPRSPLRLSATAQQQKRKRPARLSIPTVAFSFAPPTMKTPAAKVVVEEDERYGYSVCCKKGRRESMEDRYSAVVQLQENPKQAFFGVFDGHSGAKAAEFAAANLEKNIVDEIARRGEGEIKNAVKHGYLNTDAEFLKENVRGGSCCVTALIRNGYLVVSNAGDCRAVISRGGMADALTSDHRPSRQDEKERIESMGGYVDICHGVWRIEGSLAVSRGIGDCRLKQWVIAEPETRIIKITPEHEFLILASDGLWDKVSNQEAVDIVRSFCVGVDKPEPLSACRKLVDLSVSRDTFDDVTVMVIPLGNYM